jgi:hypothetical protein
MNLMAGINSCVVKNKQLMWDRILKMKTPAAAQTVFYLLSKPSCLPLADLPAVGRLTCFLLDFPAHRSCHHALGLQNSWFSVKKTATN